MKTKDMIGTIFMTSMINKDFKKEETVIKNKPKINKIKSTDDKIEYKYNNNF